MINCPSPSSTQRVHIGRNNSNWNNDISRSLLLYSHLIAPLRKPSRWRKLWRVSFHIICIVSELVTKYICYKPTVSIQPIYHPIDFISDRNITEADWLSRYSAVIPRDSLHETPLITSVYSQYEDYSDEWIKHYSLCWDMAWHVSNILHRRNADCSHRFVPDGHT